MDTDIGLDSLGDSGASFLGIVVTKEILKSFGICPVLIIVLEIIFKSIIKLLQAP